MNELDKKCKCPVCTSIELKQQNILLTNALLGLISCKSLQEVEALKNSIISIDDCENKKLALNATKALIITLTSNTTIQIEQVLHEPLHKIQQIKSDINFFVANIDSFASQLLEKAKQL